MIQFLGPEERSENNARKTLPEPTRNKSRLRQQFRKPSRNPPEIQNPPARRAQLYKQTPDQPPKRPTSKD